MEESRQGGHSVNIVVAGYVAAFPLAGYFWHPVFYALGFRALGHEVWFLDDSGDYPSGYDPDTNEDDPECRAGTAFLEREMALVGLKDRWVFRHMPSGRHVGMDVATTADVLAAADVFVNVSCMAPMRPEYARIPHRLAIDCDPVFTQVRIAYDDPTLASIPETHTRLFTLARPPVLAQRHEWVPTRQAVATAYWPIADPPPAGAPFTTVMTWRAYSPVTWQGREFGGKDLSFPPYLDLPTRTQVPIVLALGAGEAPEEGEELLHRHGWELTDPIAASRSSDAYRAFIAASAGEFSVAKQGYVATRSGWFSERTCCYLASGRPAVVQETGFSDWLPTGEGLVAFSSPDEAVNALEAVASDWAHHAAAARRLVEQHFEASTVCAQLLEASL